MIRFSLQCDNGHAFEGWFASGTEFDSQAQAGLVSCPTCGSLSVGKLLMTPNVTTGRQKDEIRALAVDIARKELFDKVKETVREIRAQSEDVGERFPEEARKIHYGETDARGIIGKASFDEAAELIEEGIEIAALPDFPEDGN